MMYHNPTASRKFDAADVRVLATDGDPDALAFYDPTDSTAWLTINDPVDLRAWR